jgi:hypothetical protein
VLVVSKPASRSLSFWLWCGLTVLAVDLADDRSDLFHLHLNVRGEDSLTDPFHI